VVEELLDHDPRRIYFLFVTDLWARRKNTRQLVDVFRSLRAEMPDARLVVKNTDTAGSWPPPSPRGQPPSHSGPPPGPRSILPAAASPDFRTKSSPTSSEASPIWRITSTEDRPSASSTRCPPRHPEQTLAQYRRAASEDAKAPIWVRPDIVEW
jgi:hypothetical protein